MIGAKCWQCMLVAVGVVVMTAALVLALGSRATVDVKAAMPLGTGSEGESFVYRFDPTSESVVFTFTIPTADANPWDVVVVPGTGHLDVWFTESGVDRIGRLTYTDTTDYVFHEYTLTEGSRPLNLVAGGGFIWFTAADGDYIGRLEPATGQISEFGVTVGSYPADLDCAPDGSVWFTQMMADRIARLIIEPYRAYQPSVVRNASGTTASASISLVTVARLQPEGLGDACVASDKSCTNGPTATGGYIVTEYFDASLSGGRPYGIVTAGTSVYFAQTANDQVTRFTPPDSWVHISSLVSDIPDEPYALALDSFGGVWGVERAGNRVSRYEYGTFPIVSPYGLSPSDSLPTSLVADANDYLWFTQWQAGQVGRLIPSGSPQKDYYPLPLAGLTPTGIATDSAGYLWVLASRPYRIRLPLIIRS